MKISRTVTEPSGQQKRVQEVLPIDIKPGWKAGTKVTFQGKGERASVCCDASHIVGSLTRLICGRVWVLCTCVVACGAASSSMWASESSMWHSEMSSPLTCAIQFNWFALACR